MDKTFKKRPIYAYIHTHTKKNYSYVHPVGFEPTPPERIELESTALDHSATDAS